LQIALSTFFDKLRFYVFSWNRFANEQAAYEYWLRRVNCCVEAEQAYGLEVVYRMHYSDVIERPKSAMHALLDFPGEPYSGQCLESLVQRINSANVPVDFNPSDPSTNLTTVEQARQLSDKLRSSPQQGRASLKLAEKLEAEFNQRVEYFGGLGTKYSEAQNLIAKLERECAMLNASPAGGRG